MGSAPSPTAQDARLAAKSSAAAAYIDVLASVVRLRLEAGAHPDDAMLTASNLMDAWIAVHIDGDARSVYGDGRAGEGGATQ